MRRTRIIGLCLIVIGSGLLVVFGSRALGIIAATALIAAGAILTLKNRAGNI